MKRSLILIILFTIFYTNSSAQKSKVIAVFQLIETGKYGEAKTAIEDAITEESTEQWARTWYARGLLCQTAYEEGIKKKDKKKTELYPDQLKVAFDSYEKARALDKKGRYEELLEPNYVLLANDFQELGEKHFKSKNYEESLQAFEHALDVTNSPILSVQVDTNLIYNTALAAYESKQWDKAIQYLEELNAANFSSNIPHLLYTVHLETNDTMAAKNVLTKSIHQYEDNEDLILILVDLLFQTGDIEEAIKILDKASSDYPSKYIFPYTKGLIHQKTEQYEKAIIAYKESIRKNSEKLQTYVNIGTCYYNTGVEIQMNARAITNNKAFREEKQRASEAFKSAVVWFEKAYDKDPDNKDVIRKLYQLYKVLGITDKIKSLEEQDD